MIESAREKTKVSIHVQALLIYGVSSLSIATT